MATTHITPADTERQLWKCRICKDHKPADSFSLSRCKHTCDYCKQFRTCKVCKEVKPISEFYKHKNTCFARCGSCSRKVRKVQIRKQRPRNPKKRLTKNCLTCGKEFSCWLSQNLKYCSYKCRPMNIAHLPIFSGKDHPNWLGGHLHYYGPDWDTICAQVRERDKACRKCGKKPPIKGRALDVHHIAPFRLFGIENHKEANQLSNLVTLCRKCHTEADNLYRKIEAVYIKLVLCMLNFS